MKKRDLKRRPTYEYRCDERLKAKSEGSTRLTYTGFREGLEHLKIKTRLTNERFVSDGVVCDLEGIDPSIFNVIHGGPSLDRMSDYVN